MNKNSEPELEPAVETVETDYSVEEAKGNGGICRRRALFQRRS